MDHSSERLRARELYGAFEALSDGLCVFDAEEQLVFHNARMAEMHPGLEGLFQQGMSWAIFLSEAQKRGLGRGLEQLDLHIESGAQTTVEVEAPRPGDRWMRLRLTPTETGGFVLTVADITEARDAAELRAEADGLLRQVLDACAANLMMTRIGNGEILYRNPASAALFGKRSSAREVFEDAGNRPDMLAELLAAGYVDDFETNLVRADGSVFPGRVSARLVEYAGEEVIVSSAADMTQLYAQRDELARQREASFQNEKLTALGELLAGVAHELNNPLSVVVGQALMLKDDTEGTELFRRVDKISQSAERCAKIVKTFLAMARQKPARLEPVSMNAVTETAVDVAGFGIRASGGTLEMHLAEGLPPARADEDQIAQVLVNLLVNAEQATKDAGAQARVVLRSWHDAGRGQVVVSVSDNGPGIPAATRARIFEPFFTTKKDGAGVGLALCHRIVSGHSGTLRVDEAPGGGALFELSLPVSPKDETAPGGPRTGTDAPALHALLVEDEPDVSEMLAEMLQILGVDSTSAVSAEAALAALDGGLAPDVILSDFVMPGMGGAGLLRALRQDRPALAKRLAFITGDSLGGEARALGHPVLEKPVAPHDLRALLRDLIG